MTQTIVMHGGTPLPSETSAADVRLELVDASTVKSEPIRWLWPGWLARGKLHVMAGAPGTGKTTIGMQWAASVSAGRSFPSGWKPTPGRVLIWSGEDDIGDTLKPRLIAAGADLARVQFVGDVRQGTERYAFDPARDVPTLAAALAGADDVALIVIDPLVSAVSGDSHKNAEVRRSLAPLVDLAGRIGAALLGITHYSKGTQGREPLERVSGSLAFGALARLVFGTVKQKANDDTAPPRYLLARVKSNIGPDGGGFSYTFEQTENPDGITASRIVFGEAVEGSARDLLAEAEADPDGDGQDAAGFLRDLLTDGPMPTKEVFREAQGAGYSRDQVKRAKAKIGAVAEKQGMTGGWLWRLPALEGSGHAAEGSEGSGQNYPHSSHPSGNESHSSDAANGVEAFDL